MKKNAHLEGKKTSAPVVKKKKLGVNRNSLSSVAIYDQLKAMLSNFDLKPGQRLNEIDLSKKLFVSKTPLREALNQLMVEGFLERTANKGFSCRQLGVPQIMDLYEYRIGLEIAIARLACARATDEEIMELEAAAKYDASMPESLDSSYLLELDEQFHMKLARLARNKEYFKALSNVNARIRYVRWIDMRDGRRPYTQSEHLAIVAAVKARDPDKVVALLEQHISRRQDQITEVVKLGFAEIYTRAGEGLHKPTGNPPVF